MVQNILTFAVTEESKKSVISHDRDKFCKALLVFDSPQDSTYTNLSPQIKTKLINGEVKAIFKDCKKLIHAVPTPRWIRLGRAQNRGRKHRHQAGADCLPRSGRPVLLEVESKHTHKHKLYCKIYNFKLDFPATFLEDQNAILIFMDPFKAKCYRFLD